MANTLTKNVSQIVLKQFLPGFMDDLVLAETVERQMLQYKLPDSDLQYDNPEEYGRQVDAYNRSVATQVFQEQTQAADLQRQKTQQGAKSCMGLEPSRPRCRTVPGRRWCSS